jgi:TolA-binding protein
LSLAKSYVSSGSYAIARTKLQKIIDESPGTKAAGEAKKLLEEIKDK